MADPDLVTRILRDVRGGDSAALDELVRAVLPELRAFVRLNAGQHIRDRESSADLVQSVCREVIQDLDDFRGDRPLQFKKWLYTLALRKIMGRGRYHGAERRAADRESGDAREAELLPTYASVCTPSRAAAAREQVARVEAAFDQLPEADRSVLTMACVIGLSYREIAEGSESTETAVRKQVSRARARLSLVLARTPQG